MAEHSEFTQVLDLSGVGVRSRKLKTSERVARDLANFIVANDLKPGTKLPPEQEMVAAFNVGRTTLREALRLLETRGVMTIHAGPGGGPVVRTPSHTDLADSLTLILQFERSTLADVVEAREALEPMIARLAARRISDEQIAELEETVELMLTRAGDHTAYLSENRKFHGIVAAAAGNTVLRLYQESVTLVSDRARANAGVSYPARRHRAVAEAHSRIIDAFRRHDPDLAQDVMHEHLDQASRYWKSRYGALVSRPVTWAD